MNSLGMHIIVDKNRNELLWVSDECKICMGWAFSIWGEGKEVWFVVSCITGCGCFSMVGPW